MKKKFIPIFIAALLLMAGPVLGRSVQGNAENKFADATITKTYSIPTGGITTNAVEDPEPWG
jgi:hypothetical protein